MDDWLKLATRTRARIDEVGAIILQNWACEAMEILPNNYNPEKPLSQSILKSLAELSALTSVDNGRNLLLEAINHRKMPSINGGRNSYEMYLTKKDVASAINQAHKMKLQDDAQAVEDQSKRAEVGVGNKPASKKRKRDALSTPSPSVASISMRGKTLGKPLEETPEPLPQETRNKKSSAKSWWSRKWTRTCLERDTPPLTQDNKMLDQGLTDQRIGSATVVREDGVQDEAFTDHQNGPAPPHHHVDSTFDEDLVTNNVNPAPIPHGDNTTDGASMGYQPGLAPHSQDNENLSETQYLDISEPTEVVDDSTTHFESYQSDIDGETTLPISLPFMPSPCLTTNGIHQAAGVAQKDPPTVLSLPSSPLQSPDDKISYMASKPSAATIYSEERLTEALAMLESERFLSSDIISMVLETCAPSDCFIVDPLFVDPQFKSMSAPRSKRLLDDSISRVIIPLHHTKHSHWTIVVFRREETTALHLDSSPSLKSTIDGDYFHQCMQKLDQGYQRKEIVLSECPVQPNVYDCGVYTIANALYYMAGLEMPPTHEGKACRQVYRAMISHHVDKVSSEEPSASAGLALIFQLDPRHRDAERRHEEVQQAFLELGLGIQRAERVATALSPMGVLLDNLLKSKNHVLSSLSADKNELSKRIPIIHSEIQNTENQSDPLLARYSLPNLYSSNTRANLEKYESCSADLEKHFQRLQHYRTGIQAAQNTFKSMLVIYEKRTKELETQRTKLKQAAKEWYDILSEEMDRTSRTLTSISTTG